MGPTKTQKAAAGSKKQAKAVEAVVTVKTLLMKTKTVQPRLTMTDVFNDDVLLEELHDLRASKKPVSVVPLTFLEPTARLGFFSSDTEIQPKTVISKKVTTGSLLLQNMANVSAAVLQGEKVRCHGCPFKFLPCLTLSRPLYLSSIYISFFLWRWLPCVFALSLCFYFLLFIFYLLVISPVYAG